MAIIVHLLSGIFQVQGTAKNFRGAPDGKHKRGIKNVGIVQQTGTGCHKIFSGVNHGGYSKVIRGSIRIDLAKEGFTQTTIRSVMYSKECQFRKKGSFEWWMGVVAVLLVLLLACLIYLGIKAYQRRAANLQNV